MGTVTLAPAALPAAVRLTGDHLYVPLPRSLWRSAGPCDCPRCEGREGYWDTLAVHGSDVWPVHYPELHG